MILQDWLNDTRAGFGWLHRRMRTALARQPALAAVVLLAAGVAAGAGALS
jgi:hypothetical protein